MAKPKRRWLRWLGATLVLLFLLSSWVYHQLQPDPLARLILAQAGKQTGLVFTYQGKARFNFKPEPFLVLPSLQVRVPGSETDLLSSGQLEISIPWSTLTGDDWKIARLTIDGAVLDAEQFMHWYRAQPPTPPITELPKLPNGLLISNARVNHSAWQIDAAHIDLSSYADGQAFVLNLRGNWHESSRTLALQALLEASLTPDSTGAMKLVSTNYQIELAQSADIPVRAQISGAGEFELQANYDLRAQVDKLTLELSDPELTLQLDAKLHADTDLGVAWAASGVLQQWPDQWAEWVAPVRIQLAPVSYTAEFNGSTFESGAMQVKLSQDDIRASAAGQLESLLLWIDAESRSLLPPLAFVAESEALAIDEIKIRGLKIQLDPPESTPVHSDE